MISPELQRKVIEQINQSGFPLELDLIEKLRSNDNLVFSNISFQSTEGSIKEIDIVAFIRSELDEWELGPSAILLTIECKKTSKYPWVFFEQSYDPMDGLGLLVKADYYTDFFEAGERINPLIGCMNTILASHHYNQTGLPIARTYFELGKTDKEPTAIYKAIMNILHSRKYLFDWRNSTRNPRGAKGRTNLNHYAIVLDGELIVAKKEKKKYVVEQAPHIILKVVDTISPSAQNLGNELIIDVITKDNFDSYLKMQETEARLLSKHLSKIYKSGMINPTL